ncbi:MAG: thioredoxin [Patescibacteria group bacterium]|nr:thioredoxin [Patescibacteria group bacterium]
MLEEINDQNFKAGVIDAKTPVMVDFYASWCGPCQELKPYIEELAKKYTDKIKIYKMNVEDSPQTPSTFGIMSVPNILFFKNGKIIEQYSNGIDLSEIEDKIKELIK